MDEQNKFYVAAYSEAGDLEGVHNLDIFSMSEKWITLCGEYLNHHGNSFEASWSGVLSHIRTKFTSEKGVALVTISAHDRPLASILLASGKSKDAELSIIKMFINSLIGLNSVRLTTSSDEPFRGMLAISDRPLMIVVPHIDENVDERDHSLVRELSLHLAGAYFLLQST
jgi:hypothetical protein